LLRRPGSRRGAARAWVEQQARIEAKRPKPDLNALRTAIRQRFPGSFSAPGSQQPGVTAAQNNSDIDAVVFVVLMQAAQDAQSDLEEQMKQMQAIIKQKQAWARCSISSTRKRPP